MNDSKRNQTLNYLNVSKIADIDKTTFDIGWNACAQDVLDTLIIFMNSKTNSEKSEYANIHQELFVYFSKLKVVE